MVFRNPGLTGRNEGVWKSLRAVSFLPSEVASGHVERHTGPGVRQASAPSFTGPRAGELVPDLKEHDYTGMITLFIEAEVLGSCHFSPLNPPMAP